MDLSTIENRVKNGLYQDIHQCFEDLEIIWNNCIKYNGADAIISQMAIKLRKVTNILFKKSFNYDPKQIQRKQENEE